ncbi:hypothetical protein WG915_05210 [Corynebacterium sp. H128]|uniref:hypothetical protein n=1 Tax=unclassified Corynebacterium TaxID=2624378 RepID=UPI0030B66918
MSAQLSKAAALELLSIVRSIPGVHDMHPGLFGEVALLYPGERVPGVRVTDHCLEIHVVATRDAGDLRMLGNVIVAATQPLSNLPVHVTIGDID